MTVNKDCPESDKTCTDDRCPGGACYARALKSDYPTFQEKATIHATVWPGGPSREELNNLYKDANRALEAQRELALSYQKTDGERHDPVNHPKHYTSHPSGVECIEITRHMGFNLGNVVKYIWRDGIKEAETPIEDLKKALWYLKDEIAVREERDK